MPLTLDALAILDAIDRKASFACAAHALENRTRQVAGGWEPLFPLAVEGILPIAPLLPLPDAA